MWKDAMEEEMNSLYKNDTWELTELPKGKKAIGCKWVYAKKQGSLKEDMVAKGYCNTPFPEYVLSCVFRFSDRIFRFVSCICFAL